MSYLDKTGLSHFFAKLKGVFAAKNHTHTKADIGLGNVDNVKQLPIAGGTMTGTLTLKANQYEDSYSGALNANNSDIYNLNSIYTADTSDKAAEGIHFYRDATHVDTLWANGGDLLFVPKRALGTNTTKANSEKVARLPASVTTGQIVMTDGTTGKLKTGATTQDLDRPTALRGFDDPTLQSLVSKVRANRLAFLPGDQIIIEKTTDGGETWVDAGVSDDAKSQIFSDASTGAVYLPYIDGVRNLKCGLRITITAMKYNVPDGTPETEKYNYWNVDHLPASGYQERYCTLKDFYFYITSSADSMGIKIERSNGKADHAWVTVFDDPSFYMTGWSGVDYVRIPQSTFGGGASQTGNYWNYRFTFMTKGKDGTTTMGGSATQAQGIYQINAYGDNVWAPSLAANPLLVHDHMYSFDRLKNVTFPAKVTATDFSGKFNGHTINADVPSGAKFTDTTYTAASAAPGKIAKGSAQGISTNYARQDHTHGIDVATGDANGQVKIAGQNISVKGLAALAYKASLGKSDVGLGNVDNTADADKEVKNATVLKTARNLSGIAFDGSKSIHRFGLCSTAANVAAKTVTLEDDMPFTLEKGAVVFVKMTNANSIANPTLNVNDTGAKAIKRYATTAPGTNADQSWVAGSVRGFVYDGSYWMVLDWGRTNNDNTIPQAYCSTAAGTAAKAASMTGYALLAKSFVMVNLTTSNTAAGPLTLTINSKGAKPIYINGAASSATHNSLPAGSYLVYYDGTNYYFRTDGKIAAEGFSGSGADLTDLNASELSSGTVPTARLPVATEDANGIVNNMYIRKMNELWETHEATTVNNSVVSGAFAITINSSTSWHQDSYTDYWYTKINLPAIKRGAEIVIRYDDCQFLYMLEPPEDGWIEALDGEAWLYTKTLPDFSVVNSPDWIRVSAYFINHTSIDSGRYDPPFKMEKIWENANPTATFPPQMLDLNLRAYDMAVIETLGLPSSNDQGICYVTGVIVKGVTSAIMGTAKTSNRVGLRKYT
ncbi:MAG: hypothetical protein J6A79_08315, partial [Clostridia bacterium]|nr:hypothetical protein [Clostridia bacterium]